MTVELFTPRLSLRKLEPADSPAIGRLYADARVMQHIQPGGRTETQTAEFLARTEKLWSERGFGFLVVRERESTELIGVGGLLVRQPGGPVEIGYALSEPVWGRGYATEVTERLLRWGFEEHGLPRIIAVVLRENLASVRVLEKAGLLPDGETAEGALRFAAELIQRSKR